MMNKLLLHSVLIAIVLNLILPHIVSPFATPEEVKPPNGAGNLSFKGQIVHMLVHHNQVPLSSSCIVGLIVGLSVFLAQKKM